MFNTDCNRFSVIQRPQKRDLDLFFVQNYCNIALQRPFIDTLMIPYWNIAFFMSIDIKTSKYQALKRW